MTQDEYWRLVAVNDDGVRLENPVTFSSDVALVTQYLSQQLTADGFTIEIEGPFPGKPMATKLTEEGEALLAKIKNKTQ